jgi:hypothetical protein
MPSLRPLLRLNAASCLGFGLVFVGSPEAVAGFLGAPPRGAILLIGVALIVNGIHLVIAARRPLLSRAEMIWFSLGDLAWWLMSLGLIASGTWVTSPAGVLATALVAAAVAGLGLGQLWHLGLDASGLGPSAHAARIVASWRGLPGWVKVWLLALNAVFLSATAFVPSDLAQVVLVAYVASGPLLAGFAFIEGGLTRAMGLGHLLPWTPMLVWLLDALGRGVLPPAQAIYALCLTAAIIVCLGFDLADLVRWWRGERAPIGIA